MYVNILNVKCDSCTSEIKKKRNTDFIKKQIGKNLL